MSDQFHRNNLAAAALQDWPQTALRIAAMNPCLPVEIPKVGDPPFLLMRSTED